MWIANLQCNTLFSKTPIHFNTQHESKTISMRQTDKDVYTYYKSLFINIGRECHKKLALYHCLAFIYLFIGFTNTYIVCNFVNLIHHTLFWCICKKPEPYQIILRLQETEITIERPILWGSYSAFIICIGLGSLGEF